MSLLLQSHPVWAQELANLRVIETLVVPNNVLAARAWDVELDLARTFCGNYVYKDEVPHTRCFGAESYESGPAAVAAGSLVSETSEADDENNESDQASFKRLFDIMEMETCPTIAHRLGEKR